MYFIYLCIYIEKGKKKISNMGTYLLKKKKINKRRKRKILKY